MPFLRRKSAEIRAWARGNDGSVPRKALPGFFALAVAVTALALPHAARAEGESQIASTVLLFLARILQVLVGFLGDLLLWMTGILINIAQYNDFITAPAVVNGWVIVRDVTNMFFVLVLLLIAFGTMLGNDKWNYKNKTVNKLLVAAIVVNFSRTIVGLLIDFSQVVMLTFVLGFKEIAGGNFANAFRINKLFEAAQRGDITQNDDATTLAFDLVMTYLLALVMMGISLAVIVYMTVALLVRIVYLWLLVVLSPLAFFLRAVPGKEGKFSEWWEMLMTQLVFGPLMAFFLWLSLASVAGNSELISGNIEGESIGGLQSAAWSGNELQAFIVAIALLLGGVQMAEKMAGSTGALAKKLVNQAPRRAVQFGKGLGAAAGATVGKISIPLGKEVRDAETGKIRREMVQLGALTGAGVTRVKSSALAKTLFDKDYKANKQREQEIKALDATGQKDKANALREELYNNVAKTLPKDKGALRATYEKELKENPGSTKQKAAALKLAEAGLLEKGELEAASKGDKSFEKMLTDASAKSGKKPLMGIDAKDSADARKQAQELYDGMAHQGERSKLVKAATDGAMRGRDGQPRDKNAIDTLTAIDPEHFKDFSDAQKKQVLDTLELAAQEMTTALQDPNFVPDADFIAKYAAVTQKTTDLANKAPGVTVDATRAKAESDARLMKERGLLVSAGATETAFAGLDPETGNFPGGSATAQDFKDYMAKSAANRKAFVKSVPATVLMANGGDNDMAAALFEHMDAAELADVVKDLDVPRDKAFAVAQAAKKMQSSTRSTNAALNAADVALSYKSSASPLSQAYSERSYKADAGRVALQAGTGVVSSAATGLAVAGAVAFAPGAISATIMAPFAAKVGKEIGTFMKDVGEQRNKALQTYAEKVAEQTKKTMKTVRKVRYGVPRAGMKV